MAFLARFWIWGLLSAAGLGILGVKELRLLGVAKAEPQSITCAMLAEHGPGDNAHVVLTDFALLDGNYVVQHKRRNEGQWTKVWIPAVPAALAPQISESNTHGAVPTALPDFRVIVMSTETADEAALGALALRPRLQGLIINEVDSLGGKEREHLRASYPNTDLGRCWILEVGRAPKQRMSAIGMLVGGAAVLAASLFLRFRRNTSRDPEGAVQSE